MTTTLESHPSPATRRSLSEARTKRWSAVEIGIGLVIAAGAMILAYPSAATWYSDIAHASTVSGYAQAVSGAVPEQLSDLLADAHDFNDRLPDGPLRDPYVLNAEGGSDDRNDGLDDYVSQLSLYPGAPMARIRIPEIGVDLPVYHGTDEATLAKGIGHLRGSALPVGGSGTHAVLTGHSGIPGAVLFDHLKDLEEGDLFYIQVAGSELAYRVDRISTVLPDDGDELRKVAGHDYVTLLTCTPTGVNTHRLLVRGERVDRADVEPDQVALAAAPATPAPLWEALIILTAGLSAASWFARPRIRRALRP